MYHLDKRDAWHIDYVSGELERQGNKVIHSRKVYHPLNGQMIGLYCITPERKLVIVEFNDQMSRVGEIPIDYEPVFRDFQGKRYTSSLLKAVV